MGTPLVFIHFSPVPGPHTRSVNGGGKLLRHCDKYEALAAPPPLGPFADFWEPSVFICTLNAANGTTPPLTGASDLLLLGNFSFKDLP